MARTLALLLLAAGSLLVTAERGLRKHEDGHQRVIKRKLTNVDVRTGGVPPTITEYADGSRKYRWSKFGRAMWRWFELRASSSPTPAPSRTASKTPASMPSSSPSGTGTPSTTVSGSNTPSHTATSSSTPSPSASSVPLAQLKRDINCALSNSPLQAGFRTSLSSAWTAFSTCVSSYFDGDVAQSTWAAGSSYLTGGWSFVSSDALCTNAPVECGTPEFGYRLPSVLWTATRFYSAITVQLDVGSTRCGDGVNIHIRKLQADGTPAPLFFGHANTTTQPLSTSVQASVGTGEIIELITDPLHGCHCDNPSISYSIWEA